MPLDGNTQPCKDTLRRRKRRANVPVGTCMTCLARKAVEGRKGCEKCMARNREHAVKKVTERRAMARREGLCIDCFRGLTVIETENGRTRCSRCSYMDVQRGMKCKGR